MTKRPVLLGIPLPVRLGVLGVALFVAAGLMLLSIHSFQEGLSLQHKLATDQSKEFGVWAAYQVDKEAVALKNKVDSTLFREGRYSTEDLILAFDLFYSRTQVMNEGTYRGNIKDNPGILEFVNKLWQDTEKLQPYFDRASATGSFQDGDLEAVAEIVAGASTVSTTFLNQFNNALNYTRGRETDQLRASLASNNMAIVALVVFAIIVGVVVGLIILFLHESSNAVKQLNEKLRVAADEAEAGNKAKSTFLATMSHEIRTPLNGMVASIDLLASTDLAAHQRHRLETARRSGEALLSIISDVLDFSKLERGIVDLEFADFDLRHVVSGVVDSVTYGAAAKGIEIKVSVPSIRIRTDEARLRQVLFNLVGNAVKFTNTGTVELSVSIESIDLGKGSLRFVVRDTGIGIPLDGVEKLFKEFSQVDNSIGRRFGGSGLGLAISKRLIDALDGTIGVQSVQDQGSVFWFTLPVTNITSTGELERDAAGGVPMEVRSGARVLLVEDHPVNQEVATGILQTFGLEVVHATNGAEAIAIASTDTLDLILMDIQMPGMTGLEATVRIKEAGVETPIVGLTGNAFTSDRDACLAVGMVDFVSKPITRDKLQRHLCKWLPIERPNDAADTAEPDWASI